MHKPELCYGGAPAGRLSCATRVRSCATTALFTRSDALLELSYDIQAPALTHGNVYMHR